jgi:hypothetical protein
VTDAGGNQTTVDPVFVDAAAAADVRQQPSSPTIDAGAVNGSLGTLDFEGETRVFGPLPDIGADERVVVVAPPPPPSPPVIVVPIPPAPAVTPSLTKLRISPVTFSAAPTGAGAAARKKTKRKKAKRLPVGTTVSYSLNVGATVHFTALAVIKGRTVRNRCVGETRRNRRLRRCTRLVPVKGGFARAGRAGVNGFRFTGWIAGRRLAKGKYVLFATPEAGGRTGVPRSLSLTIG